jgi:glycosyltransferase involved in cell wall biosynthesis
MGYIKVCFVVPHLDGSMRLLADLLRYLRGGGISVRLVVLNDNLRLLREYPEDIEIFVLRGDDTAWQRLNVLKRLMGEAQLADVLIAWAELTPTYLTLVAGWRAGKPVVGWVHTHLSELFAIGARPGWAHGPFVRVLYRELARVVAVSREVERDLRERWGLKNVVYIANGVDLERVRSWSREGLRSEWEKIFERPVLIHVGKLSFLKGQDVLLRAHALVRRSGVMHNLLMVGDGSWEEKRRLWALVEDLGVKDSVYHVGFQENPYPLMRRARSLIVTSRVEGFGLVVVEALALGVPVVATKCPGGLREILECGRGGLLVPVGDVEGLAAAMRVMLSDEVTRRELGRRGMEVAQRYDVRVAAAKMKDLIEEVQKSK